MKRLFVAVLYCNKFATFDQPMKPVAIVATSYDEAMGKAIAEAKREWRGDRYRDHGADVRLVPQELVDRVGR